MRWMTISKMVGLFALLVIVWPNFIHEPLHYAALKMQGSDGHIVFGMHPYIVRTAPLINIWWGLFYVLLPSIVSVLIIVAVLKSTWSKTKNPYVHFVLPVYLVFDLIVNVVGYRSGISDFQFLQYFSGFFPRIIVTTLFLLGVVVIWKSMDDILGEVNEEVVEVADGSN